MAVWDLIQFQQELVPELAVFGLGFLVITGFGFGARFRKQCCRGERLQGLAIGQLGQAFGRGAIKANTLKQAELPGLIVVQAGIGNVFALVVTFERFALKTGRGTVCGGDNPLQESFRGVMVSSCVNQ